MQEDREEWRERNTALTIRRLQQIMNDVNCKRYIDMETKSENKAEFWVDAANQLITRQWDQYRHHILIILCTYVMYYGVRNAVYYTLYIMCT